MSKDIIQSLENYIEYADKTNRFADSGFYKQVISEVKRLRDELARERATIDELRAENERIYKYLSPRFWTQEMHDAWHNNIPNTQEAFDAIANEIRKG